jgi:hypothetical protein
MEQPWSEALVSKGSMSVRVIPRGELHYDKSIILLPLRLEYSLLGAIPCEFGEIAESDISLGTRV